MKDGEIKYLVMSVVDWSSFELNGFPLPSPIEGCDSVSLVFNTPEQAEEYSKGRYTIYPVAAKEQENDERVSVSVQDEKSS
jgi:hypothetical protein